HGQHVWLALVHERSEVPLGWERSAILAHEQCTDRQRNVCVQGATRFGKGGERIRMKEGSSVLPDHFSIGVAVHPARGRVGLNDDAVQIGNNQAVTGGLENAAVLGLLLAQPLFRLTALNRGRKYVGDRLQEVDVVAGEPSL